MATKRFYHYGRQYTLEVTNSDEGGDPLYWKLYSDKLLAVYYGEAFAPEWVSIHINTDEGWT